MKVRLKKQRRETNAENDRNNKRVQKMECTGKKKRGHDEGRGVRTPAGPPAK